MNEGAYFPSPMEAPIMGKGFPDIALMEKWHKSRKDGKARINSYSGAEDKQNFAIMPHELMVGLKNQPNDYTNDSSAQIGFTAVPGLDYDHSDPELIMSDYYFIGVPTDEWYYKGESMYSTDSLDHGLGVQISGKCTTINTSNSNINAGDYVAWRFPETRMGDPGKHHDSNLRGNLIDTGFNSRKSRNRMGTPFGKPVIELEKFDPLNFDFQLSAAFKLLTDNGNLSDYDTINKFDGHDLLTQQAFSWGLGLRIIALLGYSLGLVANEKIVGDNEAKLNNFAINLGLLKESVASKKDLNVINELYKIIFRKNGFNNDYKKYGNLEFDKLMDDGLFHLTNGVSKGMMLKLSRVIGKAVSSAGPSKSIDIVLVGARIGI